MNEQTLPTRQRLLEQIEQLARHAIYGTLSESYRTCGNPRCRCHAQGLSAAIWKSCKSAGLKTGFCGAQIFFKSFSTALFFLGIVRRGSSGFGRVIF